MEATEGSAPRSSRRSFLLTGAAAGATVAGGRLLSDPTPARAGGGLTPGDAAILRFLAALETIETDVWQQYLGDTLPQAIPDLATGEHPGIPRSNADLTPSDHLQAIANTAG